MNPQRKPATQSRPMEKAAAGGLIARQVGSPAGGRRTAAMFSSFGIAACISILARDRHRDNGEVRRLGFAPIPGWRFNSNPGASREIARLTAERNKTETAEKRRQKKQSDPNERGPKATAKRKKRALTEAVSEAEFTELVQRFKRAEEMCSAAEAKWIEGSIAKAMILVAMRNVCPADQEFGARLEAEGIRIHRNDRAALISLGRLGEARMRAILEGTDSRSYQLIWGANKPQLSVVEN